MKVSSDKVLHDNAFQIANNLSVTNINVDLHQWSTNVFDKNCKDSIQRGTGIHDALSDTIS